MYLKNCRMTASVDPDQMPLVLGPLFAQACLSKYSEPSLQQHLFSKILSLKWIFCYKESLTDRMICKKDLVLLLFPHRVDVLVIC